MNALPVFRLIGRGIYSVPEAQRLTRVPALRIRRWIGGYSRIYKGKRVFSEPIVPADLEKELGVPALNFVDLLEVRFLNAFRQRGVKMRAIRIASINAKEILGIAHPFSSKKFSTDGHTILAQFVEKTGDPVMLDLVKNQYELEQLIWHYLVGEIEFDEHDNPARWWPVESKRIVIDPQRSFGAPIVDVEGIPTRVLAKAVAVEDSVEFVAEIYRVDPESVAEAVEYENALARA